jgi:hypothetical protein
MLREKKRTNVLFEKDRKSVFDFLMLENPPENLAGSMS